MASIAMTVERNHRLIITLLVLIIIAMAASCIFHDVIPICHLVFGCDHKMHAISSF